MKKICLTSEKIIIHIVRMYLHGEDDRDLREDDCIWIERPFVAGNVGADQKRIDGTLGLGETPGNLDRLRVEKEKKNKQKQGETKAARNAINLILISSSDEERKGGKGRGKRGKEGGYGWKKSRKIRVGREEGQRDEKRERKAESGNEGKRKEGN